MKLKFDDNGNVVVQDGKPVYVYDDGKEVAFDALQATQKITQLNSEAKAHREAKEAVERVFKHPFLNCKAINIPLIFNFINLKP